VPETRDRNPQPGARKPPPFRPRFTIGLVYMAVFFVLFQFLQVLPELIDLLRTMEAGVAQQQAAEHAMRVGSSPLVSLVLALAATSLGSYYKVLPGMRV